MTQKPFGVKQLNVIGAAGTPTIESAGDLNIGGQQVAITTNTSISGVITATAFSGDGANITGISTSNITNYSGGGGGGGIALTDLSVSTASVGTAALSYNNSNGVFSYTPPDLSGYLTSLGTALVDADFTTNGLMKRTADGVYTSTTDNSSNWDTAFGWGNHASAGYLTSVNQNFSGIVTATSFQGNTTTGDGSDRGFTTKYYITSSGSSAYRFAGPGVLNSTNNPTLYFHRGFTYILENSTGSGHPFALRVSSGGSNYAPGGSFLTGSQNGTQILTVPFDGPSSIVYQCTLHGGMLGTINFVS